MLLEQFGGKQEFIGNVIFLIENFKFFEVFTKIEMLLLSIKMDFYI